MSFLSRFSRTLAGSFARALASLTFSARLEPNEPLTNYLNSAKKFDKRTRKPHVAEFIPKADGARSVFRTKGLSEDGIWRLGEKEVIKDLPNRLHARADVTVQVVMSQRLGIDPDQRPSRHANIAGWPAAGSEVLLAATALANAAQLYLNPAVYP
jgi:hypothetical protein